MSARAQPSALSVIIASGLLVAGLALATTTSAQTQPSRDASTMSTLGDTSLASCPARKPVIRIAGVFTEEFSPHPVETRFSSTHYTWMHQIPLFGADPWEEKVDPAYGVAESWEFLPGARGIKIKVRKGLTFGNGAAITAKDVAFSIKLFMSKFADDQVAGALRGIGITTEVIDDYNLRIDFAKGAVTFPQEFSPLVFPLYVTSEAYHSNGEVSQEAIERFRANPLAAGPYRVAARQAQQFMTLEAARKDPLLGCPLYDRVEIRHIAETGTRMAQFRTGALDIIAGNRDLIQQIKGLGAQLLDKPANNMIGLYIFQTYLENNVFRDERVRKAAAHSIDHKLLAETIWKGIGVEPWGCTWPPSTEISMQTPGYAKACGTPYAYDPGRARQLLAEAGFGSGRRPAIKLVYWNNYPEEAVLAEALQPMLNAVGFNASVERIDRAEWGRRQNNKGLGNSIMFFGPGGRVTALSGAYFAYAGGVGPIHDQDVQKALARASGAATLDEYMDAMTEIGRYGHERAYSPGFFSAGAIWFVRAGIPDWGLNRSKGRGPLNLLPLVADLRR
jgi:ABC-type transport system substrate-binding protein